MRSVRLLFLSCLLAPMALAETRVFVSLAGTLLEAEITAVSGDNVTLKRSSDQQTLVVSRRTLCKEDGEYIARWQAQHANLPPTSAPAIVDSAASVPKYSLTCQTLPAKSNRGRANSDYRVFEYTYNFNLSNREVVRDLQNARGLAVTLGKNVADPNGDLVVLQKEEFEVNIRAQSKMLHTTQPVRLSYSEDPDSRYGVRSYGYVLIIRDAAGNVLHVEASPDASAKYVKEILSIPQAPCMVDRDFRLKTRAEIPLGYISF
jgi:hypothetical protein